MKPRNKYEREVAELTKQLPPIEPYKQYAIENGFKTYVAVSRNRLFCLDCNHKWNGDVNAKSGVCPNCGKKYKRLNHNSSEYRDDMYLMVMDKVNGFQVLRHIWVKKWMTKKRPPHYYATEVVQQWIDKNGRVTTFALPRVFGYSSAEWQIGSDLSIKDTRSSGNKYVIYPHMVYPSKKLIKEVRRAGFKGGFHDIEPVKFISGILSDSKCETALKRKDYRLLDAIVYDTKERFKKYWSSIKICFRNNYTPSDLSDYMDYLSLLDFFGKDLHSPKYVCPDDLKKVHDRFVKKKAAYDKQIRLEKQIADMRAYEATYAKEKAAFLGLAFKSSELEVRVLNSVQEFKDAADKLKHCVFTNEYYKKDHSLVLAAVVNGELVETVEVSLERLRISQSRGFENKPTEHHDKIIQLVESNMPKIAQAHEKALKAA